MRPKTFAKLADQEFAQLVAQDVSQIAFESRNYLIVLDVNNECLTLSNKQGRKLFQNYPLKFIGILVENGGKKP